MTREQERRILNNQVLIMQALAMLMVEYPAGRGAAKNVLDIRVKDVQTFIQDYLK